jgi:signal transduction histidine kinase
VLTVVDDGPGVPRESREAVFELFTHATGGEANPGAGVGLATSRTLARALGGDLVCVDPAEEPGAELLPLPRAGVRPGAAFRLTLPLAPTPAAPVSTHLSEQLFA